jgi:hypothetical protein
MEEDGGEMKICVRCNEVEASHSQAVAGKNGVTGCPAVVAAHRRSAWVKRHANRVNRVGLFQSIHQLGLAGYSPGQELVFIITWDWTVMGRLVRKTVTLGGHDGDGNNEEGELAVVIEICKIAEDACVRKKKG